MMIMLKSTHDRAMAVKDAEIAEAHELIAKLKAERDGYKLSAQGIAQARDMWKGVAENVTKQRDDLRAEQEQVYKRYEPFMHVTRGPGGRWTSTKQVGA